MKVSWSCLTQKLLYMFKPDSITNSCVFLHVSPCRGLIQQTFLSKYSSRIWVILVQFAEVLCSLTVGLLSAESRRLCSIASESMGCHHPCSGLQTCCGGIFFWQLCQPCGRVESVCCDCAALRNSSRAEGCGSQVPVYLLSSNNCVGTL